MEACPSLGDFLDDLKRKHVKSLEVMNDCLPLLGGDGGFDEHVCKSLKDGIQIYTSIPIDNLRILKAIVCIQQVSYESVLTG